MKCECGQELVGTSSAAMNYIVAIYDEEGNLIYAKCIHGRVVIDKRENKNEHI